MPSASDLLTTPLNLLGQVIAFAANRASQWDNGDRSFLGKIARMFTQLKADFDNAIRQLDADWPPSNQTSPESMAREAEVFGLSNGAGGFGFKVAVPAKGGEAIAQGTGGTAITTPQLLTGPDGITIFQLRTSVTLPGAPPNTTQANVTIDAQTPGTVGNLSAGAALTWQTPPPGIEPTVTLFAPLKNGLDEEDPGQALVRLTSRFQTPPKGGAPQDFRGWAEATTDANGIPYDDLRSYGYSGGSANSGAGGGYDGVSGVVIVQTKIGSGLARMPTPALLTDTLNYIRGSTGREGLSPVCSSIRVIAPFMDPDVTGLVSKLRVVPSKQLYRFDWVRGDTIYAVDVGGWDGVSQLRITTLAPLDLKLSIQNDELPRLFIDTRDGLFGLPIGPVIPAQARIVSFADAAGKTTFTLQTPLPVGFTSPNPAGGDEVYSGQEVICDPSGVAGAVLTYSDNLGPSRVSGLEDPNDVWEDTIAIQGGVDAAAKNALASDGITPLIQSCVLGSVKLAVGNGPLIATDIQAPDNSTFGPAMLYLLRIIVSD